ncbi:MAG: thioredoxin family protein [Chloroflexota bacterium]|nr:thioredoxin family protein [Chloroflexota bacterium]
MLDDFCGKECGPGQPCAPPEGSLEERFERGLTFEQFLETVTEHRDLWHKLAKRAAIPEDLAVRARALPGTWHLLVLSEGWCGDSHSVMPYLARLTEAAPQIDLRILQRDANLDLMDSHLTGNSRSIPIVIVLDANFEERGWWGPRPTPLQEWVSAVGMTLAKEERYREVRTWYVRDRGVTTLTEIVCLLERLADPHRRAIRGNGADAARAAAREGAM